jgi:deoxyribose-phosphate aldolase
MSKTPERPCTILNFPHGKVSFAVRARIQRIAARLDLPETREEVAQLEAESAENEIVTNENDSAPVPFNKSTTEEPSLEEARQTVLELLEEGFARLLKKE